DEDALIRRIESRIAEMKARGEALRDDDSPEVLHKRLAAYRQQTAPLIDYYRKQSVLRTVNGMAPIPEVAAAVDRALPAEPAAGRAQPPAGKKKRVRTAAPAGLGKKSEGRSARRRPKPPAKRTARPRKRKGMASRGR
ncbi:MAG TPA: nucleoside monophosphate kinase, partial [Xanthobacteraceae bacterium]|nr:nucleoside monophosphate kinase [Xanthobacteraceae bacterium]